MKHDVPFITVSRLLKGYDVNAANLARILNCAYGTARSRLDNPRTFSLGELEQVSIRAGIPMAEIRDSIKR